LLKSIPKKLACLKKLIYRLHAVLTELDCLGDVSDWKPLFLPFEERVIHRDILIEETLSQKVCGTSISTGDQGGEPTLGHWPQC